MNACGETYESLKDFIEIIDLDGMPVTTLDLEGLIKKNSQRAKKTKWNTILKKALAESKRQVKPEQARTAIIQREMTITHADFQSRISGRPVLLSRE